MSVRFAYIIAGKRTALGHVGGLHRFRRLEDLAAHVIAAVVEESSLSAARVERLVLGNTSAGGNPARLVALAAGLPASCPASTIDQQCASGLEAVLDAARRIATGDADVVVAGGAEALSTAPWRIAKPRTVHHTPRFLGPGDQSLNETSASFDIEAVEAIATRLRISRSQQDEFTLKSHVKAARARDAKVFLREIVPFKSSTEECRDQSATEPDMDDVAACLPYIADGTVTRSNSSALHDGAAFVVVVSPRIWAELGQPPALRVVTGVTVGVSGAEEIEAPIVAVRRLVHGEKAAGAAGVYEMSEQSAVQAIALRNALGLAEDALNPDGGAVVRGHPLAAAGAVLVVRLFSTMVRHRSPKTPQLGVAVLGATGGLGTAALFEAV